MKIQITENIDKAIENYTVIPILYGKIDLGLAPDNSVTHVIAIDAMDSVPSTLLVDFLSSIIKKMRLGCQIILGGTELDAIAKDVINHNISTQEYNELIFTKRGIYRSQEIVKLLNQSGLSIDSIQIRGYKYELTASRPFPAN